jgi:hypothetical protein
MYIAYQELDTEVQYTYYDCRLQWGFWGDPDCELA